MESAVESHFSCLILHLMILGCKYVIQTNVYVASLNISVCLIVLKGSFVLPGPVGDECDEEARV